jgi:hypothetical protein
MKKKPGRIALASLFPILIALLLGFGLSSPAPQLAYYANPRPQTLVIAHQGGDGLWPGNPFSPTDVHRPTRIFGSFELIKSVKNRAAV